MALTKHCFVSALLLASIAGSAQADLYRWDNSQLIPGTAEIELGPGVQLDHRELPYAYFYGDLSGANFASTNLAAAQFANSSDPVESLRDANFSNASLVKAGLAGMDLTNADFTNAHLAGAILWRATMTNVNLTGADIAFRSPSYAFQWRPFPFPCNVGYGTSFAFSQGLTFAQIASTASFQERDLQSVNFCGLDLSDWDFSGQDLTSAYLHRASLTNANLSEARITGASLVATGVTHGQLESTASYQSKDLRSIGLSLNDLSGWDLSGQDLTAAHFYQSTLTNADLRGSNLRSANVEAWDLASAAVDSSTVYNQWTVFPAEFDVAAKGLTFKMSPPGDIDADDHFDSDDVDMLANKVAGRLISQGDRTLSRYPNRTFSR